MPRSGLRLLQHAPRTPFWYPQATTSAFRDVATSVTALTTSIVCSSPRPDTLPPLHARILMASMLFSAVRQQRRRTGPQSLSESESESEPEMLLRLLLRGASSRHRATAYTPVAFHASESSFFLPAPSPRVICYRCRCLRASSKPTHHEPQAVRLPVPSQASLVESPHSLWNLFRRRYASVARIDRR